MTGSRGMLIKFSIFAVIMAMLTAFLFIAFGQVRSGSTNGYSAVFADASRLKGGDSVRVAGVRVGTVNDVQLQSDRSVLVKFDADKVLSAEQLVQIGRRKATDDVPIDAFVDPRGYARQQARQRARV